MASFQELRGGGGEAWTQGRTKGGLGVGKASGELLKIFSDDHSEWRIVGAIRRFLQLQGL